MTISKRDMRMLFMLLGAVFLLVGYFAVYHPYMEKADAVQADIDELQPKLDTLRDYFQNIDAYQAGIKETKRTVQTEMEHYSTDIRPENMILYAKSIETNFGVDVTGISFDDPISVLEFQGVEEQDGAYSVRDLTAFQRSMTINCNLSYQQMKDMIDYINTTEQRTSLDSINITYDAESGELTGDATLKQYFVTGKGDKYIAADVPDMELGKGNLFGTMSAAGSQ